MVSLRLWFVNGHRLPAALEKATLDPRFPPTY
jgi:hypothetical protein